jgi:hypothetical protein
VIAMPAMIDCALRLAEKGLAIFPCVPRSKKPATMHGCKDASTDASLIQSWWRRQPAFNIGVATGSVSGIFVVDVDDGEAELRQLEAEYGELPSTVEAITARGRHLFFRYPGFKVRNTVALAPGIDIRGDGGYVVAPPSLHPSGRRYAWSVDSASSFADAPPWVLEKLKDHQTGTATPTPVATWREIVSSGVEEGERNNTVARLTGYLLAHDVDSLVVLDLMIAFGAARCRPPLSEAEVVRTVNSIARLEIKRRSRA